MGGGRRCDVVRRAGLGPHRSHTREPGFEVSGFHPTCTLPIPWNKVPAWHVGRGDREGACFWKSTETEPRSVCAKRRRRTYSSVPTVLSKRLQWQILCDVYLTTTRTVTAYLKFQPNWASGVAFADSGGRGPLARSGDTFDPRSWGGGTTGPAVPWAASYDNAVWPAMSGVRGRETCPLPGPRSVHFSR